jgi:hypothetical protein
MLDIHHSPSTHATTAPISAATPCLQLRRTRLDSRRFSLRGRISSPRDETDALAMLLLSHADINFAEFGDALVEALSDVTLSYLSDALLRRMNSDVANSILNRGITCNETTVHWLRGIAALPDDGDTPHHQGRMPLLHSEEDKLAVQLLSVLHYEPNEVECAVSIAWFLRPHARCSWAFHLWRLMSPDHARRILRAGNPTPDVAKRLQKIAALDVVNN